jgi:succinate dehydrogenase/fumarate reductase flavoprotein subunit
MATSSGDFGNEVIPETEREWLACCAASAGLCNPMCGLLAACWPTTLGPIRADSTLHAPLAEYQRMERQDLTEMRLSDEAWTSPKVRGYELESALSVRNMVWLGRILATAASGRTKNRGAHFRLDFPETDNARWRVVTRLESGAGGGIEFHKHSLKQST